MQRFADNTLDLWFVRPENLSEAQMGALRGLLSLDEQSLAERFRRPRDCALSIIGRGIARLCLSEYAEVEPADWRFVTGRHGKPSVEPSQPSLFFNVSHTPGLVVCAVSRDTEIGVDTERTRVRGHMPGAADLRDWVAKEAIAKAICLGFALPFDHLTRESDSDYRLAPNAPVESGTAERWHILRPSVSPEHEVAVAVPQTESGLPRVAVIDVCESGLIG